MWRLRRSVRKRVLVVTIGVFLQIVVIVLCYGIVRQGTVHTYQRLLEEKKAALSQAERFVYVTRKSVKAGELLTEENTEKRMVLSQQAPEHFVTNIVGLVACVQLPEGMIVTVPLCSERQIASSERECVFTDIRDTEYFAEGMVVDVRIRYENGENYCVLRKKRVQKKETDKPGCRLFLTEEEQLLMSAAQYDVQVYDGAELYFVGFVEDRLQEGEYGDYLPPEQVLLQLREQDSQYEESFSIWKEQRTRLERRLLAYKENSRNGLR